MEITYRFYGGLPPDPERTSLLTLLTDVFPTQSSADFSAQLAEQQVRTGLTIHLALHDGQVVGCKLGYPQEPGFFYSWLGAVHPDFRGQSIASELMRQQHAWCREQGYRTVRTKTYNHFRNMLILNLRSGFTIVGTEPTKRGLAILLEKKI